jgi:hypothetical protein
MGEGEQPVDGKGALSREKNAPIKLVSTQAPNWKETQVL